MISPMHLITITFLKRKIILLDFGVCKAFVKCVLDHIEEQNNCTCLISAHPEVLGAIPNDKPESRNILGCQITKSK